MLRVGQKRRDGGWVRPGEVKKYREYWMNEHVFKVRQEKGQLKERLWKKETPFSLLHLERQDEMGKRERERL